MQTAKFGKYRLEYVFGEVTEALARELADFWIRHRAIAAAEEALRRAQEVCWLARDAASNEIAAVCTVYTDNFGEPPQPHYFYRMFIRPADRKSGLATEMVIRTRASLAASYRPDQPQQGLVVVNENPMLMLPAVRELYRKWGWSYQGQTDQGCDVWRLGNAEMYPVPPTDWNPAR